MGRPTVVSDDVAAAIEHVATAGTSVRKVHAVLAEAGVAVSQATVARYLRRRAEGASAPPRAASAPPLAAGDLPASELTGLESELRAVEVALTQWQPSMGADKSAVLAYQRLVELKKSILTAINELRPRESAEAERLLVLGHAAKAELLERVRAQARADEDLRGRVQRQGEVIASLMADT